MCSHRTVVWAMAVPTVIDSAATASTRKLEQSHSFPPPTSISRLGSLWPADLMYATQNLSYSSSFRHGCGLSRKLRLTDIEMQLRQARRRSLRSNIRSNLRAAMTEPSTCASFSDTACSSGSWVERMRNNVSKRVSIVALAWPSPRLSVVPCGHLAPGSWRTCCHRSHAARSCALASASGGQSRRGRAAPVGLERVVRARGKRKWPPQRISSRIAGFSASPTGVSS